MPISLNFVDTNHVNGSNAAPVSAGMFGAIAINIRGLDNGVAEVDYGDHFAEVFDDLSHNLVRFPDGEFPDGFITQDNGVWSFAHNNLNNGVTF